MTTRISDRALVVLHHIAERSGNGMSWLPGHNVPFNDYVQSHNIYLNIEGAGDARIIKSLIDRGLVARRRTDCCGDYSWLFATDTGLRLVQDQSERVEQILDGLRKDQKLRSKAMCYDTDE